ncbi:hypothetical protein [Cylindrospermum sp. FACHB-282]|uniref:hypothetical protein n=1 Tax=Cylindrospermum sp. FACHB-282 TaxID=2692794 RepID=UPI001686EE63|nr:hypothetical protein [Cylindrospermum sp. FACHB-282]MBD2387659.1 hypothetical protein [Cylindrospermum sp. FACHB-282]
MSDIFFPSVRSSHLIFSKYAAQLSMIPESRVITASRVAIAFGAALCAIGKV